MKKLSFIFLIFISCQKHSKENIEVTSNNIAKFSSHYLDGLDEYHSNQIKVSDTFALKAKISRTDSTLWVGQSNNPNFSTRIFGYEQPDIKSKKVFLFSSFTNEVEKNPYDLKFGAFYSTVFLDSLKLKFLSKESEFSKIELIRPNVNPEYIYILNAWLEIEADE